MNELTLENVKALARTGEAIKLTPVPGDRNIFRLIEGVSVILSNGDKIVLQAGWEYDGSTVPYFFQWAFPKWGIYSFNSLVHDVLYYKKYGDRAFADKEHFIWGKALAIKEMDNWCRYLVLRAFGWIYWNKSKNKPSARALRNNTLTTIIANNGEHGHQQT